MFPLRKASAVFYPVLLACMAVALQVQITLFATSNYIGLRFSLADFFLPIAGLSVLWSLSRRESKWPTWKRPFGYWAIIVLIMIIGMGFLNGWFISGELSRWAFINKFVGWLILMAYMGLGGWIAANIPGALDDDLKKFFLVPLMATFLTILLFNMVTSSTHTLVFESLNPLRQDTLRGLMANRNSYAFFFLFLLTAITIFSPADQDKRFFSWLTVSVWFLLPAVAFLNLSRTLWLCMPLLLMALAFVNPLKVLRVFLPLALIGSLLIPALFMHRMTKENFLVYRNTEWLVSYAQNPDDPLNQKNMGYIGDDKRMAILKNALNLIKERPILGSGLGAILNHSNDVPIVLDNSPLWILTEMGIIGLAGFVIVYVCMLLALRQSLKEEKRNSGEYALSLCALLLLLTFGIFSQFHEILYSRFMWFILGLALVKRQQAHKTREDLKMTVRGIS